LALEGDECPASSSGCYAREERTRHPLNRMLGWLQSWCVCLGEEKTTLLLPGVQAIP